MTTELARYARNAAPAVAPTPGLLEDFLAGRKPGTIAAYSKDLAHFARWLGAPAADQAVAELLHLDAGGANRICLNYRNAMTDAGLAAATVNRRLAALKSLVKVARMMGRVAWSVEVGGLKPEPRRDVRGPEADEFRKLWKSAKLAGDSPRARRDRAIVALLFGMALRRGEVVALDLVDLDFRESVALVARKGKREKTRRPIPAEVARALGDWVLVRGSDPGPLFTRTDRPGSDGRLSGEGVARVVARLGLAAKLPRKVRPHGLRHSAITSALAGGVTPVDARSFSGHSKIETVMVYHDELKDTARKVSSKVAKALV
jgi:integrase/recombinase XerC